MGKSKKMGSTKLKEEMELSNDQTSVRYPSIRKSVLFGVAVCARSPFASIRNFGLITQRPDFLLELASKLHLTP
jgi:hypothetical protein